MSPAVLNVIVFVASYCLTGLSALLSAGAEHALQLLVRLMPTYEHRCHVNMCMLPHLFIGAAKVYRLAD